MVESQTAALMDSAINYYIMLSYLPTSHWDAVPSTMNSGKSQHHWTNTQTSTWITLLDVIALFVIFPYLSAHMPSLTLPFNRVHEVNQKAANELRDSSQYHMEQKTLFPFERI